MKVISHVFDKQRACEIVSLEDEHGRKHQIQIAILRDRCPHCGVAYAGGVPDPDKIIGQVIAQHEADETTIREHIKRGFDAQTLERLKTNVWK